MREQLLSMDSRHGLQVQVTEIERHNVLSSEQSIQKDMTPKMKNIILIVLCTAAGFVLGLLVRSDNPGLQAAGLASPRGIYELKEELKDAEEADIISLLNASAEVKTVDEGGLFNTKLVRYLHANIINGASVAVVKDVKLRIEFYSKTDSHIGSDEFTVYEFIQPNHEHSLKQKLNWPVDAQRYKVAIISAKVN